MKIQKILALWLLLIQSALFAEGPFNTTVQITEIEAEFAQAASVESMINRVAIFMVEPEGVKHQGIELAITSDARAMIVEARLVAGRSVPVYQRANGSYYFFGQPGEYEVGIYQFAVDVAYKTLLDEVFIGPKTPPVEPPPPVGNFDQLKLIAKTKLTELNDPVTAKELGEAYAAVLSQADGKTREQISGELKASRVTILRARATKLSRLAAWNLFTEACDVETRKAESVESFRAAMTVIAQSLSEAINP